VGQPPVPPASGDPESDCWRSPQPRRLPRRGLRVCVAAVLGAALVAAGDPVAGSRTLYQWTDAGGIVRYTPDLGRVPSSRRHTVIPIAPQASRFADGGAEAPAADPALSLSTPPSPPTALPARVPQRVPVAAEPTPAPTTRADEAVLAAEAAPPPPRSLRPRARRSESTATGTVYAVQLRATPAAEPPGELPEVALGDGEHLYRTAVQIAGQDWQRLRIGYFPILGAAQAARERLAHQFPGAWVVRVPAAERAAARRIVVEAFASPAPQPGTATTAPPPAERALAYAIQLRAVLAGEESPPLPPFLLPPGSRLYWTAVERNGQLWRRLRVGFFQSRDDASQALARLTALFPDAWVTQVHAGEGQEASASPPLG